MIHRGYMRRKVDDDLVFVDGNGMVEMGRGVEWFGERKEENVLGG